MYKWKKVLAAPETYVQNSDIDQDKQEYEDRALQFRQEDHLTIDNQRDAVPGETDYHDFASPNNDNMIQHLDNKYRDVNKVNASLKFSWKVFPFVKGQTIKLIPEAITPISKKLFNWWPGLYDDINVIKKTISKNGIISDIGDDFIRIEWRAISSVEPAIQENMSYKEALKYVQVLNNIKIKKEYTEEEDQELFKNIVSKIEGLQNQYHFSERIIQDYINGLEEQFEPDAYRNYTDKKLLKDIILFQKNAYSSLKFSWKVVHDFEEFEKILKQGRYSYHIDGSSLIIDHIRYVNLSALTSLPENIQFNNKGHVYLTSLTTLPENIQFNNKGFIDLSSLITLPANIQFNNEGEVHLDALTLLPENKYEIFKNRGKVYYGLNGDNWMEFNPNIREANYKFSSKDLSFDDYSKERGEQIFQFEKDVPTGKDALDMQQSWNTDYFDLQDTQKQDKLDDSFNWTNRENMQYGFSSLKFHSWRVIKEDLTEIIKPGMEGVDYNGEKGVVIEIVHAQDYSKIKKI